jgi:hypothetical protein
MSHQDRAELFDVLSELCRRYPNWRFGQFVSNVSGWADTDIWEIEDEQLIAAARAHIGRDGNRKRAIKA